MTLTADDTLPTDVIKAVFEPSRWYDHEVLLPEVHEYCFKISLEK